MEKRWRAKRQRGNEEATSREDGGGRREEREGRQRV